MAPFRVGVYKNPPKIDYAENASPTGFFPELLKVIAADIGFEYESVPCKWADCLQLLQNGEIDIMPDVAWTLEREELFRFGRETALHSWSSIYTAPGLTVGRLADLAGKEVAVLRDSVQHRRLAELQRERELGFSIRSTTSHRETFELLDRGDVQVGIVNQYFGYATESDYSVQRTPIVFRPSRLFFAYSPNVPTDLITAMDSTVAQLKSDPNSVYYHLKAEWISPSTEQVLPLWAYWAGGCMLAALFLFLGLSQYLRVVVQNRTSDLTAALHQAEAANHAKTRFLAIMSHELRTPLNAIIGFADLMHHLGPQQLGHDRMREYCQDIKNSGALLLEIINDVLDFGRLEEGTAVIETKIESVDATIAQALETINPLASAKSIDVIVNVTENAEGYYSSGAMRQCLINILSNAVKFSPSGSTVSISAENNDGRLILEVRDQGIGIEADLLPKLGNAFMRGSSPLVTSSEGAGLGLAITKRLLELQGGSLNISSIPGEGTAVVLTVPQKSNGLTSSEA